MFFDDWKFPIFLVQNQSDINNLIENVTIFCSLDVIFGTHV